MTPESPATPDVHAAAAVIPMRLVPTRYIPKELAFETIFGCNLSCPMCPIDMPTRRKKQLMPMKLFRHVADSMAPYASQIEAVSLWSLGEPLLDRHLCERIVYLKQLGFRNLAIATNADLLTEDKQIALLKAGIDTVIFGIDGSRKESYELIRKGATFERVVANVRSVIRHRDEGGYATRFLVRFISQELNKGEWPEVVGFWSKLLSPEKRDVVTLYDMHNQGGYIGDKATMLGHERINQTIEYAPCRYLYETLIVLSDGSVAVCCVDFLEGKMNPCLITTQSPLDVFNSDTMAHLRELHSTGRKNEIPVCANCTIPYTSTTRVNSWEVPVASTQR